MFDKNKVAIVLDHFTPNKDIKAAEQCLQCRTFAKRFDTAVVAVSKNISRSFFASSHPERGGNPGVLSSSDGARTWRQVSAGVNGLLTSIPWMSCIASPEMFPRCGRCLIRNAP